MSATLKWGDKPTPEDLAAGRACSKGSPACYCAVGWPLEEQCEKCRGEECGPAGLRDSFCVCVPESKP